MTDDEYGDHLDEITVHAKNALRAMDNQADRRLFIDDLHADLQKFHAAGCPA